MRYRRDVVVLALVIVICVRSNVGQKQNVNVTFTLSAANDPKHYALSESYSFVKVSLISLTNYAMGFEIVGETSWISDELNLVWDDVFWFIYEPNSGQVLKLEVYDYGSYGKDHEVRQALIYTVELMNSTGSYTASLSNSGTINIQRIQPVFIKISGRDLPREDDSWWFGQGSSDPYAIIYFMNNLDSEPFLLVKTASILDEDNPNWTETVEVPEFRNGTGQYLCVQIYDEDTLSDDFLGSAFIPLDEIARGQGPTAEFTLSECDGTLIFQLV